MMYNEHDEGKSSSLIHSDCSILICGLFSILFIQVYGSDELIMRDTLVQVVYVGARYCLVKMQIRKIYFLQIKI